MRRSEREQMVSATIFNRTVIGAARAAGADARGVISRLDLDPGQLGDPDAWLPAIKVEEFLEQLGREHGLEAPGLWVGEHVSAESADLLGYAMRTAASLGDAFATAARYYGLVGTGVEVYFREQPGLGLFTHGVPPELANERRHRDELIVASLVTLGRRIASVHWSASYVTFQHQEPDTKEPHVALLGEQIRFAEPATEIALAEEVLRLPSTSADLDLHEILQRYATSLVEADHTHPPLVERLRTSILEALPAGDLSLAGAARSLGMGERTLQRRLREIGTSHSELVRQTRHYLAESYLHSTEVSIDEVSFMLGYANTPAFSRAFRSWAGVSPSEYRALKIGAGG